MIGITEQTYYRWRREYGGLRIEQARKLKNLERENARLKKLVADISLNNANSEGRRGGKLLRPSRKRKVIIQVQEKLGASERRACTVLKQARNT